MERRIHTRIQRSKVVGSKSPLHHFVCLRFISIRSVALLTIIIETSFLESVIYSIALCPG